MLYCPLCAHPRPKKLPKETGLFQCERCTTTFEVSIHHPTEDCEAGIDILLKEVFSNRDASIARFDSQREESST